MITSRDLEPSRAPESIHGALVYAVVTGLTFSLFALMDDVLQKDRQMPHFPPVLERQTGRHH